jgi:hypothetical protein
MEKENTVSEPETRDEWEVKDDLRAVKRALKVFKDPQRFADVQKMIKDEKVNTISLEAVAHGDLKMALGL